MSILGHSTGLYLTMNLHVVVRYQSLKNQVGYVALIPYNWNYFKEVNNGKLLFSMINNKWQANCKFDVWWSSLVLIVISYMMCKP